MPAASLATISPSMMADLRRQLAEHLTGRGSAGRTKTRCGCRVPPRCRACDMDANAVEFDLALSIVAGWHRLLGMAGVE